MIVKLISYLIYKSYSSNRNTYIIIELGLKPSNTIVLIANILAKPNPVSTIVCYTIIDKYILFYQY